MGAPQAERPEFVHHLQQRLEVEVVVKPVPTQLELTALDSHHCRVEHRDQRARELIGALQLGLERHGDAISTRASEPTRLNDRSQ